MTGATCIENFSCHVRQDIDCLPIGMMGVTLALGAQAATDQVVIETAEKNCIVAQASNRKLGIFVPSIYSIEFWQDREVTLFLMSSDHSFIKQGARKLGDQA